MTYNPNELDSPQARAKRLRSLRMLTGLTRKEFETKHCISASTLQYWEDGKGGGLTEKGAYKVIEILKSEDIVCHVDWLLHGAGPGVAQVSGQELETVYNTTPSTNQYTIQESSVQYDPINKELELFKAHNPNSINLIVKDDGMEPYIHINDYLAGVRLTGSDIHTAIGKNCIVELPGKPLICRNLRAGMIDNTFTLTCLNVKTTVNEPVLYNQQILSVAPILWARRSATPGE